MSNFIIVCFEEISNYELIVMDVNGIFIMVNFKVEVYDIRCGVYNIFVEVCWSFGLFVN